MKKIFVVFVLLALAGSVWAKKVKFAVDMTGQTVNVTGVHISGDFQEAAGFVGGNWQSNTTILSQEVGTEIYSVVVDIPAFTKYEYKFLNGDLWYEVEFVPVESRVGYNFNDNRWIYIDSLANDTTLVGPMLFAGNAPEGQYLVRFKVDMQEVSTISPLGVHVAGSFQGWNTRNNILYSFGDNVYENIVYVDQTLGSLEYKFCNGVQSAGYETVPNLCAVNGNRELAVKKDTVFDAFCFSSCYACGVQAVPVSTKLDVFSLYPNPAQNMAYCSLGSVNKDAYIEVFNLTGNRVKTLSCGQQLVVNINLAGLNAGLYLVRLQNGDQTITRRLTVE